MIYNIIYNDVYFLTWSMFIRHAKLGRFHWLSSSFFSLTETAKDNIVKIHLYIIYLIFIYHTNSKHIDTLNSLGILADFGHENIT